MATFLFHCPVDDEIVHGVLAAEEMPGRKDEATAAVKCPACGGVHLINPLTGRVLGTVDGKDDED